MTTTANGEYSTSLGKSKKTYPQIRDLIAAQLGRPGSELIYPLAADDGTILRAPVILDISAFARGFSKAAVDMASDEG